MGSFTITFLLAMSGALLHAPAPVPTARAAVLDAPARPILAVARLNPTGPSVTVPVPAAAVLAPVAAVNAEPAVWEAIEVVASDDRGWQPPDWFPDGARDELWALEGLSGPALFEDGPSLRGRAALIYDVDSGQVLWEQRADELRPVASLTKVVSSLTTMAEVGPSALDATLCIDPSSWPGWPGAHSYLNTGTCTTGWDLLGAALVASDNRAAFALQRVSGLPFGPFVGRMTEVSRELGMSNSSFADPAGVADDNLSTARDMTRAILAASLHPTVGAVASAQSWDIELSDRARPRRLYSTNRLSGRDSLEFLAAKTGYTDTARYCFTGVVRTDDGRRLAFTLLGANTNRARWSDVEKMLRWVEEMG